MEAGGNRNLNTFLSQYGISKETDIITKYNSNAASVYRDRIQAIAEGRSWRDPPVVKENASTRAGKGKPPLAATSNGGGWDDNWDNDDGDSYGYGSRGGGDIRRNQSTGDVIGFVGSGVTPSSRSKSTEDIYTRTQLEASAANKEGFFAKKMAENESRPEGLPPSQGGKYVGFGSSPGPAQRISPQNDYLSVVSEGIGKLSMVAQSATKEITAKVKDGGYDHKVNETVNIVTQKTSEIGQRTWGIMKGVMALASQKVEEFTKDYPNGNSDNWPPNENDRHDFNQENKGWNSSTSTREGQPSSGGQTDTYHSNSWDDWDNQDTRKEVPAKGSAPHNNDDWAGWDDAKDDDDEFDDKSFGHNGTSGSGWTGGGFH